LELKQEESQGRQMARKKRKKHKKLNLFALFVPFCGHLFRAKL